MKRSPLALLTAWLALGMADASAAVTIVLDQPDVNAAAGRTLVFTGTITNNDATAKVFLNDFQFSAPAGLALQPNVFFANVPGILLPYESYAGPIFSATLGAGASPADYGGTITVFGGADIFASGTLVTTGITVFSPAVTILATVPDASEFGPVPGAFTVTRTGGTGLALDVPFSIGGSAVNGVSFTNLGPSAQIASGESSASVAVTPIPDNIAQGDRSVVLALTTSPTFNLGANVMATVTIHDKPADRWRLQNFGAAANTLPAGDAESWAQDGIANLIKYATGLDPTVSGLWALPRPTVVNGYLTLSFVPNPDADDVIVSVEGSGNLNAWSEGNVELVTLANPIPPTRRTYRYHFPTGDVGAGYLRLRVRRVP